MGLVLPLGRFLLLTADDDILKLCDLRRREGLQEGGRAAEYKLITRDNKPRPRWDMLLSKACAALVSCFQKELATD